MRGDRVGGPIRWRMHIPVSPEVVFAALDTDDGRASFWAESALQTGGVIEFSFSGGQRCTAAILEREAPRLWSIDYLGGAARFDLRHDGAGGTELLLTHEISSADPDEWNETHAGWLNVLFPLKAWLAHGVDLRNHDSSRSWNQGYADQ